MNLFRRKRADTPQWAPTYYVDGREVTEAEYKAPMTAKPARPVAPKTAPITAEMPEIRPVATLSDWNDKPYQYERDIARRLAVGSNTRFALPDYYEDTPA